MLHGTVPTPRERPQDRSPRQASTDSSPRPCQQSPELQLCHMAEPHVLFLAWGPWGRTLCPCPSLGKEPDCKDLWALGRWMAHSPLVPKMGPRNMSTPSLCHPWNAEPRRQINSQAICLLPAQSRTHSELWARFGH